MSFPGEGPVEIGQTVLAPAFAALAPMVLAVTRTVTVTVGLDGFVAEVTEQMPGEGLGRFLYKCFDKSLKNITMKHLFRSLIYH